MNPTQSIRWPGILVPMTQVQQLKAAGIAAQPNTAVSKTTSPSTQGVPQAVSNVQVIKKNLSSTQVQITISFQHNAGDPYFTTAVIYQKSGNSSPVQVAAGPASPVTFTVSRSKTPATFIVVSQGKWGSTVISQSPSKSISIQ